MPDKREIALPDARAELARRLNISLELLNKAKPIELTVEQRASFLKIEPRQVSEPIVLSPNKPRIGNSFLAFHNPLAVTSRPSTGVPPDTGEAIFNPKFASDALSMPFVEIGFAPINAQKPHLIEINLVLLNSTPKTYKFRTRMFIGAEPNPETNIEFSQTQPITMVFPVTTFKFIDPFRVVQLRQTNNIGDDFLWSFHSVKISSIK